MNIIIYLFTFLSLLSFPINACKSYSLVCTIIGFHTNLDRGDFMASVRDGYNRYDPDATLNGFFPFWGIVLLLFSCKFHIGFFPDFMFIISNLSSRLPDDCWRWFSRLFSRLSISTGKTSSTSRSDDILSLKKALVYVFLTLIFSVRSEHV